MRYCQQVDPAARRSICLFRSTFAAIDHITNIITIGLFCSKLCTDRLIDVRIVSDHATPWADSRDAWAVQLYRD